MLEDNKQTISGVDNSTIQQAQGNIANILLVDGDTTLKDIIREVIRTELNIVTKEAYEKFNQMIEDFKNRLADEIGKLKNPQEIVDKFKEPTYQFVLHDTIKGYTQSDNEETKADLIDFLIDRLQVNGNSTERFVIEDAIQVLPKLSYALTRFLGAVLMRRMEERNIPFVFRANLKEQARLYEHLDEITNLDIAYLHQLNCCRSMSGLRHMVTIEEEMKIRYDLFFRQPTTEKEYSHYISSHPALAPGLGGRSFIFIDTMNNNECRLYSLSSNHLKDDLQKKGKMDLWPDLQEYIKTLRPYTEEEIRNLLVCINPNWEKIVNLFHQESVQKLELTPVGVYIANKIVQKERMRVACATLKELF